ncbi:MAG: threonine/serine exporter family protein [Muribaculaceae bacterium]|nr:threonine/serine exporter family protein [Muribaculaceae bacterium]
MIRHHYMPTSETTRRDAAPACLKDICIFLSEYAAWLLGSGATCIRMERNISRMAGTWNCRAEMTILPRHIHITVSHPEHSDSYTYIIATHEMPISFEINTLLSRLSWEISDRKLSLMEAKKKFQEVIGTPGTNRWLMLILAACANASFCRLFSGDMEAVGVIFLTTLAGFFLKQELGRRKVDVRLTFILCAFVSSVLASGAAVFHLGTTPETAVGTSVLYLVPGIPFLNSFSDMLAGHYICSFGRLVHAVVLTCCLSLGLLSGMLLSGMSMF